MAKIHMKYKKISPLTKTLQKRGRGKCPVFKLLKAIVIKLAEKDTQWNRIEIPKIKYTYTDNSLWKRSKESNLE